MEINVTNLVPMQDGFRRSAAALRNMLSFVRNGGRFDPKTLGKRRSGRDRPIVINQFEGGRSFIHDGLHRTATILAGREPHSLYPDEYTFSRLTYKEYDQINLESCYFTPFDPRTEVRIADFQEFKTRAHQIFKANHDPSSFIRENRHLYSRPRQRHHESLDQLIKFFFPELL